MSDRLYSALGRFVVRFRWLVVVTWIAAIVVTSAAFPSLSSEINNDNSQFLPASTPSSQAASLAAPILGSTNDNSEVTIVAVSSHGAIEATDQAALTRIIAQTRSLARVASVQASAVSTDGSAVQILVHARINQADITDQKTLIAGLERVLAEAHAPPGLELELAGAVATNVANQASSQSTGNETQLISFVFIIVLLLLIFRSLLAPLITLLPAGVSLLIATRLIGELGAHGLKISEITELLLIILMLGAGTDYGLFLVFRVREEIRRGMDGRAAVEHALVRVGESITASAATVILALLTLLLASFGIYHDLGVPLAIGVAVILLAGLTLLPALLAIFGKAAFWPTRVAAGQPRDGAWGKIAARMIRRPAVTLTVGVLLFGGLAVAALDYHSSGFGGAANAPKRLERRIRQRARRQPLPAVELQPRQPHLPLPRASVGTAHAGRARGGIAAGLRPVRRAARAALAQRHHAQPRRLLAPARAAGQPRHAPHHAPGRGQRRLHSRIRRLPLELRVRGAGRRGHPVRGHAASRRAADHSRARRHAEDPRGGHDRRRRVRRQRLRGRRRGRRALRRQRHVQRRPDQHHPRRHPRHRAAARARARSLVAPLYLIVSVAFSYLAALGVATLIFIDIVGEPGLTFILPFLMFIFLLALGEDYNILVMTRIREEARTYPLDQAVVRAVARTGSTVTSAGLVLAGTFGVLAVVAGSSASGSQVRAIGAGLAVGILMDTFLVRTLLVPATVTLLGRWNWWPSAMSRVSPVSPEPAQRSEDRVAR